MLSLWAILHNLWEDKPTNDSNDNNNDDDNDIDDNDDDNNDNDYGKNMFLMIIIQQQ